MILGSIFLRIMEAAGTGAAPTALARCCCTSGTSASVLCRRRSGFWSLRSSPRCRTTRLRETFSWWTLAGTAPVSFVGIAPAGHLQWGSKRQRRKNIWWFLFTEKLAENFIILPLLVSIWVGNLAGGPLGFYSLFCRGGLCSGRCCEPSGLWLIFRSMYLINALCWICFNSVLETPELENALPLFSRTLLLDATASCSVISSLTWLYDTSLSIRQLSFSGSE